MSHRTQTQDSGLRVTQTGNVSQDRQGQWRWDRNDRKCVTGHRAVEMRQEWQERCHRTQTHGSGDETGMSGDARDRNDWRWDRQEWQERCHRHRAVEMKLTQTGKVSQDTGQWRWNWHRQEWRERCHRTQTQGSGDETNTDSNDRKGVTGQRHRAVEMKLTQTGITGKVSQDTRQWRWNWHRQERCH